jgi:uncharacterized protein YdcH (DUF465 family)
MKTHYENQSAEETANSAKAAELTKEHNQIDEEIKRLELLNENVVNFISVFFWLLSE